MAIRQSDYNEIRYLKRQNLEQTSRLLDNMYRDQIHAQGLDCIYHKLDTKKFKEFKGIVDANTIIRHAYGYDDTPDYSLSAEMPVYMEVDNDIFNLNKYGLAPDTETTFVFHKKEFACMLASKCGQYKEYKIDEKEIICDIPEFNAQTSADAFPYLLGAGYFETFTCGTLSGKLSATIESYEEGKEQTILCHPYEHSDFVVEFPVNSDIYKSFTHKIKNNEYVDSIIKLTFTVNKVQVNKTKYKHILHGKLHGTMLFYDITNIGKYTELIHPEVGDVIAIDFPDEANREQYELTEVFDKQMTSDGINPFMHKYVWKCKAKRYHNSYENITPNEANDRLEESLMHDQVVREQIAKEISIYDDGEDKVYGGYDGTIETYDKQIKEPERTTYDWIPSGMAVELMLFGDGTKLVTNGYDLTFVNSKNIATDIAFDTVSRVPKEFYGGQHNEQVQYLKATDDRVVFVNIAGEAFTIAEDEYVTSNKLCIALNSLYDMTFDTSEKINKPGDNFYKFKGTRTVLISIDDSLYVRLVNGKMYKIA